MSTETMPSKPKTFQIVINVILILINVNAGLVTLSASQFIGLHFYERVIIIVSSLLLAFFMIVKEFKLKPLVKKIYLNLLTWAGYLAIGYYISVVW